MLSGANGQTVYTQAILSKHEPKIDTRVGSNDLPMPRTTPHSTSMVPQRKYGVQINSIRFNPALITSASTALSVSWTYIDSSCSLKIMQNAPSAPPVTITTETVINAIFFTLSIFHAPKFRPVKVIAV